ncbi:hypothetical protein KKA13_03705 [Patescibacteria group bacterium]|nr:hypothetical protein [Patescibacteria group bacterium]MBU1613145.1 hypothetical protein [Patescibacteria group bacterium]
MGEIGGVKEQGPSKEKKSIEIICRGILNDIREFSAIDFANFNPDDREGVDRLIGKILSSPVFDAAVYRDLKEDSPYLCKFMGHDLGNLATVTTGNVGSLRKKESTEGKIRILENVIQSWPAYSLILEDICLRGLDKRYIDKKFYRDFSIEGLDAALDYVRKRIEANLEIKKYRSEKSEVLKKSPASHLVSGRERADVSILLKRVCIPTGGRLALESNEKLIGVPGVIVNAVCNITRNAAGEYIKQIVNENGEVIGEEENGAKNVVVEQMIREDEEWQRYIVFRIIDDGRGMSPDYLQPGTKNYIFFDGRSHRFSSGYGLTNMPDRLHSTEAKLRVWTFERDKEASKPAFYDSSGAMERAWLEEATKKVGMAEGDIRAEATRLREEWITKERVELEEQLGFRPSTVFEVWGPKILENKE